MVTRKIKQIEGKDKIVVGEDMIGKEDNSVLICSYCNWNTVVRLRDAGQNNFTLFCTHCSATLDDSTIRKESKLGTQIEDKEPAVSVINYDYNKEVEIKHVPPIRGGFLELQKKGLRIYDYKTTEKE